MPLLDARRRLRATPRSSSTSRTSRCSARASACCLASRVLAAGLRYDGADFRFEPPRYEPFALPSLAVIGTGKRVGKTAVTGHVARLLARDRDVVVVAMGRGRPGGAGARRAAQPTLGALLALSRRAPRRLRLPRDRGARGRRHGRLPPCGGGLAGAVSIVERLGGRSARGRARPGSRHLRRQRRRDSAGRGRRADSRQRPRPRVHWRTSIPTGSRVGRGRPRRRR